MSIPPHTPPGGSPLGLRRSVRLFKAFRVEQTDPARFYRALAQDTVELLRRYEPLSDKRVVDVGAGPGWFQDAFLDAGAQYLPVDVDPAEIDSREIGPWGAVVGNAEQLPLASSSADIAFSSNVLEHVADPWLMWDEMVRVTRPGGLVVVAFTTWWGPWGGHETAPWHFVGGEYAARRYERRHGRPPKNRYGSSLFAVTVAQALAHVRERTDVELIDVRPRYLPSWARPVLRVPGGRELFTWNLWVAARRRP